MAKFYKNTRKNVVKIFRALNKEDNPITIGEIARRTGLHKWVVSRTLDVWMDPFVDVTVIEELEALGLRMKLDKIKKKFREEQIIRGLEVKNKI